MKSPKLIFIPGFTLTSPLSKRQNFRCFGVLPGSEFADSKSVLIKINFEEANFSDFKRLVVTLKINPQKYNWPPKTCKPLKNTFPGSNLSVIVMRIEQSEVYVKGEGHSKKRIFFVITNKKFILS